VDEVENLLTEEYTNVETVITEDINSEALQHFTVSCVSLGEDMYGVVVSSGGRDPEFGGESDEDGAGCESDETLQYDNVEPGAKEKEPVSSEEQGPLWNLSKKSRKKPAPPGR
jgi:hypothetical protein